MSLDVQLSPLCPLILSSHSLSHGRCVFIEHACTAALTAISVHPENLHKTIFITYSRENVRSHVLLNDEMITNYKQHVFLADCLSLFLTSIFCHSPPRAGFIALADAVTWSLCCKFMAVVKKCVRFTQHAALPFPS